MYTCIYAHKYIYIYIHTHTHTISRTFVLPTFILAEGKMPNYLAVCVYVKYIFTLERRKSMNYVNGIYQARYHPRPVQTILPSAIEEEEGEEKGRARRRTSVLSKVNIRLSIDGSRARAAKARVVLSPVTRT